MSLIIKIGFGAYVFLATSIGFRAVESAVAVLMAWTFINRSHTSETPKPEALNPYRRSGV